MPDIIALVVKQAISTFEYALFGFALIANAFNVFV